MDAPVFSKIVNKSGFDNFELFKRNIVLKMSQCFSRSFSGILVSPKMQIIGFVGCLDTSQSPEIIEMMIF